MDYPYFKTQYKMITIDLSKQHVLDTDPKAIQQTENLDENKNTKIIFIIEEAKETIFDFSQGTMRGLYIYFVII